MRTEILVTLLFVAAASASIDGASDDGTGMCPMTYLKKHPNVWEKTKELMEKYGPPDFSKLKSCSGGDATCDKGMKCCETPCGMKCMKVFFEDTTLETIEQSYKEIAAGVDDKPYEITLEDKKYGMCPSNYMKVHREAREKFNFKCKHKHSHECKHGEQCSHKHAHHKKHGHLRNFTAMADCSVDGDCGNNMRCCNTICGKKCMKPIFTMEDLEESFYGEKEENKNREKRDVENEEKHGKGGKHGKGHGEGAKHGKGHEEGAKHGKGHGEGAKHGKGHEEGAKHGKGHEEGAKHGKGHGEGTKHGKGHGKSKE